MARLLSDEEFSEYISALEQAAAATSESHDLAEFDLGFASASVYPKGERPGTTTHEGPMLDGDLWPRFATWPAHEGGADDGERSKLDPYR